MNRRAFLAGLLATTAIGTWAARAASTEVDPALAEAAKAWQNRYGEDLTEESLLRMSEQLRGWYLMVPAKYGMSEVPRHIEWSIASGNAEWSTGNLKYPTMRVRRPAGWRDWYGTEGL